MWCSTLRAGAACPRQQLRQQTALPPAGRLPSAAAAAAGAAGGAAASTRRIHHRACQRRTRLAGPSAREPATSPSPAAAGAANDADDTDGEEPPTTLTAEQLDAIQRGARQRRKLRKEVEEAAAGERYAEAARLRDELAAAEALDPLVALARRLECAAAGERYAEAARLRDALRALEEQVAAASGVAAASRRAAAAEAGAEQGGGRGPASALSPPPPPPPPSSDVTTHGVRVVVRSALVPSQSSPADGRWFFVYRVRITNVHPRRTVQLRSRHWVIRDAGGRADDVRGPGVVGEMPVLPPAASFEYESACPLRTATGSMEGSFEFEVLDPGGDGGAEGGVGGVGSALTAEVGRFGLGP